MAVTLPQASFAAEQAENQKVTGQDLNAPPDATIDFEATQMRLILGGAKGKGVLHFQGKDYPFTMEAVSVGGVGYSEVAGTGTVHYLKKVEDFAGRYNAVGAGAVVGGGKGASTFENGQRGGRQHEGEGHRPGA